MSRSKKSIKNIKYSVIGQILAIIMSFITRMVFVKTLSAEYLGLNGLFSNILSILSLAELGVGASITYSMYNPLANNDRKKIIGLMDLYKKAYIKIGFFVLVSGTLLLPFLDFFIKDIPNISNIKIIYIMYVVNSAFSYFYSYKKSLLVADQKKYIESMYHYSLFLICNFMQILVLLITRNFLLYLCVQISITIIENLMITKKVDAIYPFLKENKKTQLGVTEKKIIFKNVKAMIFHKIGTVIVMGTDNLLISKFVGIAQVGIYSNYLLVMQALDKIFTIIFQSMTASIGNLGATETASRNEFIFRCIDLLGLWIYGFASIALVTLFNPFIELWLGDTYLLPTSTVSLIVISFYLTGRRKSVLTFRDALGLFWYDRHKPIFESIINLAVSIILVKIIGFEGVIIGTIISTLTTSYWIEPFVLYKYGFSTSMKNYLRRYIIWTFIIITIGSFNLWLTSFIGNTLFSFLGKIIITAVIPNIIIVSIFWKTEEFQYLANIIKPLISKIRNKNNN